VRKSTPLADVIPFRPKASKQEPEPAPEIDLLTAVDVAIRDLREISQRWGEESARRQAEECRAMLEGAFEAAVSEK
jgi:hypothetical protein